MRTKKIKAVLFILIVMVCGISFIGCDAEGSSSQSGASEGTSSPSSAVPSGGNTTDTGNQAGDNTTDKVYNIIYNNTKGINNLTPVTFKTSDTIVLPSISIDGWTFGGWSDSSTDENVITGWSAGDHSSDVTLWAVWTANTYTVTLQNDGDVSGDASVTATFDANLPSLQTKPSKVGYNFGGYWMYADGQGTQYIDANGDGCKKWDLTSDTTLIAFFMEHGTHMITYNNLNGATSPSKTTFKESETIVLETINMTGYSFDGWYDASTDGNVVTGWAAGSKTDNVIVYAHWTAEQYDITYKDEGENVEFSGTMTGEPTKHTYGTPTALPVPTKTGYEFGGWFVTSDCADNSVDTLGAESFTENITLYAKWNICEYDIVYKNVQGLNNTNATSYTVLDDVSLSDLSAQGWMFDGWSEVVDDVTADTTMDGWNAGRIGNVTLWANLARGYRCSASEMSSLLGPLSAENGPYLIRITDLAPDLSLIKTALQTRDVSVDLDLSGCTSLIEIGQDAFFSCANLSHAILPETLTTIGNQAFRNCTGLKSIKIPDSVISIGNSVFCNCLKLEDVIIGANVPSIPYQTFRYCKIKNIVIPDSVTSIGEKAFLGCENLTSIVIPDSVTSISGQLSFSGCTSLTSVTLSNSVTNINSFAFRYCSSLISVNYTGTIADWCGITFGNSNANPLYYAHNLYINGELVADLVIPNTVTEIKDNAFQGCSCLTSLTIPNSVTSIGSTAFQGCFNLAGEIIIPDSVTSIGVGAFNQCGKITSITIPFVGGSADATENSDSTVFGYIFGVSSYDEGIEIEQYYAPDQTKTYYIPSSLRSVTVTGGKLFFGAFYGCSNLTSITLPDNLTNVSRGALFNCAGLTSVTIPSSVTNFDQNALNGCSGLITMNIKAAIPPTFGSGMLTNCSSLTTIYVPTASVSAYKAADGWSDYADKIVAIPTEP